MHPGHDGDEESKQNKKRCSLQCIVRAYLQKVKITKTVNNSYFIMQQFRQSPASHLSSGNKFQQQLMSNYLVQHREPSVGHSKKYSKCHPMIVL